ncbi:nuclease [Metarhizobium album]|uniref:Nuclease n=1 Tax=Metarhizobium album TaxID=2182425 RepID=A0A2U2DKE8_9HYPH|nr:nuclease [Rhizobium album]
MSGDTLWFPQSGQRVKLAGIDACALPQWAFDPKSGDQRSTLAPVPCGPFAKAWLKRLIGNRDVACKGTYAPSGDLYATCSVSGRDLGLEQLKVGWARTTGSRANSQYVQAERYARSARYGMWGTYVLDMAEWREKAIDRSMERRPQADKNLLRDRRLEITPPFADWRNRPRRTDR